MGGKQNNHTKTTYKQRMADEKSYFPSGREVQK